MPVLNDINDVLAQLGHPDVLKAQAVRAGLEGRGFTLSPALTAKLSAARPLRVLAPGERARWAQKLEGVTVTFGVAPPPPPPKLFDLPIGEFDFIFGIRLEAVTQILGALYADLVFPHQLDRSSVKLLLPAARLAALCLNLPATFQLGALHFTAAPTAQAVSGAADVILTLPITIDIEAASAGGTPPVLTKIVAMLSAGVAVSIDPATDGSGLMVLSLKPSAVESVQLNFDPASPVQPKDAASLTALEVLITDNLIFAPATLIPFSPTLQLPFGQGASLGLQSATVQAVPNSKAGALLVGALLGAPGTTSASPGDVSLLTDPFSLDAANIYARFHEALLSKAVKAEVSSGALTGLAGGLASGTNIAIDSGDVALNANQLVVTLRGRALGQCGIDTPFGTFGKVDVGFTATLTYNFSVYGSELVAVQDLHISYDTGDYALCILEAGVDVLLAGVVFGWIGAVVEFIVKATGPSPPSGGITVDYLSSVFALSVPVPGTELLPEVQVLQQLIEPHVMRALGTLTFLPDSINTYIYAKFTQRGVPLAGLKVEVVDQDVPRPAGDDIAIPKDTANTVKSAKFIETTSTHYEAPTSDPVLASATTDHQGLIQFVLSPAQLTTQEGTEETVVTTVFLDGRPNPPPNIVKKPVLDPRPDLYLRVTLSDGKVVDTRKLPNGFYINLTTKHIGTATSPITFDFS